MNLLSERIVVVFLQQLHRSFIDSSVGSVRRVGVEVGPKLSGATSRMNVLVEVVNDKLKLWPTRDPGHLLLDDRSHFRSFRFMRISGACETSGLLIMLFMLHQCQKL